MPPSLLAGLPAWVGKRCLPRLTVTAPVLPLPRVPQVPCGLAPPGPLCWSAPCPWVQARGSATSPPAQMRSGGMSSLARHLIPLRSLFLLSFSVALSRAPVGGPRGRVPTGLLLAFLEQVPPAWTSSRWSPMSPQLSGGQRGSSSGREVEFPLYGGERRGSDRLGSLLSVSHPGRSSAKG